MKFLGFVGTRGPKLKSLWQEIISLRTDSFKHTGESNWNPNYPKARKSYFGEMIWQIWKHFLKMYCNFGAPKAIHWKVTHNLLLVLSATSSKAILSPSDYLYLSKGQSFIWENTTGGEYSTWRKIYENFTVFPSGIDKKQILGAEVCLWGEVSNEKTFENNLWPRSTAFAAKVWSKKVLLTN